MEKNTYQPKPESWGIKRIGKRLSVKERREALRHIAREHMDTIMRDGLDA